MMYTNIELSHMAAQTRSKHTECACEDAKKFVEKRVMPRLKKRAERGHNFCTFFKPFFMNKTAVFEILKEECGLAVKVHLLHIELFW